MFLLPSRSRPHNVARFIRAWQETGATTPLWLRLDDDDQRLADYRALAFPAGWAVDVGPRVPLSAVYNEAFAWGRGMAWWGFIADDVVPLTPGWDVALIAAAGSDRMAVPAGGHYQQGTEGAPHFVLGGDLPRETGWLCLPGLCRLYIDTVWADFCTRRGALVRCPEIVLEHRHFSNRMAVYDETYRKPRAAQDKAAYQAWLTTQEKS